MVNTGAGLAPLQLGAGTISPPTQTGNVQLTVNLNASTVPTDPPYSTPIQIYDSLGAVHNLTATFTNTGANSWSYSLSIPAGDLSGAGATGVLATGTLTFNGNGVLTGDTAATGGTVTGGLSDVTGIPITGLADGASDMTFNWNVLNGTTPVLSQVAAPNGTTSLDQDGSSSGSLASFSIGSDGTITGSFSNGKTQALGQIALASFSNNNGLQLKAIPISAQHWRPVRPWSEFRARVNWERFPAARWSYRTSTSPPSSPT